MEKLNFYPYYEDILRSCVKTTTFRLNKINKFKELDTVMLTLGWDEKDALDIHGAVIEKIYRKRICDLNDQDFEGESLDCKSQEATKLVLSCIYRKIVNSTDEISIIKFRHEI